MTKDEKRVIGQKENIKKRIRQFGKNRMGVRSEEDREIYNKMVDEIIQEARGIEI